MIGGMGDDTYYVDNAGDVIVEASGGGTEQVFSSATYALVPYVDHLTLIGAANIDAIGNTSPNNLVGNVGNNGLFGGDGADNLTGAGGADSLTGGAGADTFVFLALTDSQVGAYDTIQDFVSGTDKINLAAIDADTATAGDQAFYLNTNATIAAKEIQQTVVNGNLLLEMHVNGDTVPDMSILIVGRTTALTNSDFIF